MDQALRLPLLNVAVTLLPLLRLWTALIQQH